MRLSINWRFLILVAVVLVAGLAALHFAHKAQVRNLPAAFLRQADAARDAQDVKKEKAYLERYVLARSDDLDARERLVRLIAKTARGKQKQNAYLALDDLLRRDPSRDDLRRFAAIYAMSELGQTKEALEHIEVLLKKTPEDAELRLRKGACLEVQRKFPEAEGEYKAAYTAKPTLLPAYAARALVLRKHRTQPDEANTVIELMVAKNATNPVAHLQAVEHWRQVRNPERARAAMAEARKLAPDDLQVILGVVADALQAALAARRDHDPNAAEAKFTEARAELDRGAKLHPKEVAVYQMRAQVEGAARGPAEAVKALSAGLTALPDDPTLLGELAENQIDARDASGASATLDRLEKLKVPAKRLALDRARVKMLGEDWAGAASLFDQVRTEAGGDLPLARKANLFLGRCLTLTDEYDRALDAFTRAVPDEITDPLWASAVIGQAEVYQRLNRLDDAVRAFRKVAADQSGVWLPVARLEVEKATRAAALGKPDWREADRAVQTAARVFPDNTEVALLQVQLLAANGKAAEARKVIDDLFAARPKDPLVWQAKATVQLSTPGEGLAAAIATVEKGRSELGDPIGLRLLLVVLSANPNDPQAAKKLAALAEGMDKYPPPDRLRLIRQLASAAAAVNDREQAARLWNEVVKFKPNDVSAHEQQYNLARQAGDEAGMERALAAIRLADGEAGLTTRVTRGSYLLWRAEQKKDLSGLPEALALFDGVEKERADWSFVPLTKALIYDTLGKPDDALRQFERAKALGENRPEVLRRMIGLMAARGRHAEANEMLGKLPADVANSPDMRRMQAELARGAGDAKKAIDLAAKAVPADSKEPADLLWLGRFLLSAGDPAAAEKPLRTAVGVSPEQADGWLLLVECLARNGRRADAEGVLAEGEGKVKKDAAALLVALGNGILGKADEAKKGFARARAERPTDPAVLTAEANYLTDTQQWEAARQAWERVATRPAATPEEKRAANQMLAVCLAADPDYATAKRAIELLAAEPGIDKRTRITVLAIQRDRSSKLEAVRLLEADRDQLTPAERFQLAMLYNQVGDRGGVRATMTELLRANPSSPLYLGSFAGWLVEQKEYREAEALAAKLPPDTPLTLELQARVQAGLNNKAAARATLKKLADRPKQRPDLLAKLAEEIDLPAEAEGFLKKLVDENKGKAPEVVLVLAGFHARQNRPADALAVCEAALATARKVVVCQAAVEVLTILQEPTAAQLGRVGGWVEQARAAAPAAEKAEFDRQLAYIRNLQGKYDDALDLYTRMVAGDRPDPSVLNNLAYLMSTHRGRHDEALALLDKAKRATGPIPDLLDTEAIVRVARGGKDDLKVARTLLKEVAAEGPNAVGLFHLVQLEEKAGDATAAAVAWREAVRLKLKKADLHPLEWPAFQKMGTTYR